MSEIIVNTPIKVRDLLPGDLVLVEDRSRFPQSVKPKSIGLILSFQQRLNGYLTVLVFFPKTKQMLYMDDESKFWLLSRAE